MYGGKRFTIVGIITVSDTIAILQSIGSIGWVVEFESWTRDSSNNVLPFLLVHHLGCLGYTNNSSTWRETDYHNRHSSRGVCKSEDWKNCHRKLYFIFFCSQTIRFQLHARNTKYLRIVLIRKDRLASRAWKLVRRDAFLTLRWNLSVHGLLTTLIFFWVPWVSNQIEDPLCFQYICAVLNSFWLPSCSISHSRVAAVSSIMGQTLEPHVLILSPRNTLQKLQLRFMNS